MPSLSVPKATGNKMSSSIRPTGKNISMPPAAKNPGQLLDWSGKLSNVPMKGSGAPYKNVNNQTSDAQTSRLRQSGQEAVQGGKGERIGIKV
ncbi:MAG: hypothetical protein HZB29_03810 [Nitrospinae bacterium]|nr:hypothetical protein [Nitrospinota bacterium]